MKRGKFIVLEGIDGSGKTSQMKLLVGRLKATGRQVVSTAEPSTGPIGALLRLALSKRIVRPNKVSGSVPLTSDTLALLFTADRMDHLASFIDPALAEGKDVVCDRYALGTLAYQSWSDEDQGWIKGLNLRAQHPDMTIFLSLPVEMALKRISGRGNLDIFENQEVLERVVLNFRTALSDAMADGQEIAVVNGTDPVETVADNVWWNVERILQP